MWRVRSRSVRRELGEWRGRGGRGYSGTVRLVGQVQPLARGVHERASHPLHVRRILVLERPTNQSVHCIREYTIQKIRMIQSHQKLCSVLGCTDTAKREIQNQCRKWIIKIKKSRKKYSNSRLSSNRGPISCNSTRPLTILKVCCLYNNKHKQNAPLSDDIKMILIHCLNDTVIIQTEK